MGTDLQNPKDYQLCRLPFHDGLAVLLEKLKFLLNSTGADLMSPQRVLEELHLFVPTVCY